MRRIKMLEYALRVERCVMSPICGIMRYDNALREKLKTTLATYSFRVPFDTPCKGRFLAVYLTERRDF
jgi:hypothetical protein